MALVEFVILFIVVYVCVYALIDRMLKCVEHCATARAYRRLREAEIKHGIEKAKEEKNDVEEGVN